MAHQHNTNSLHSLHAFSVKTLCRISSTSPESKATVQAYILRRVCHVVRAVAYAKSMAIEFFNNKKRDSDNYSIKLRRKKKKKKKVLSSIKLCFTWSSSYVIPVSEEPDHSMEGMDTAHEYYDPSWNSMIRTEERIDDVAEPPLSGYLRWLEEKDPDGATATDDGIVDIDRLAEKFIENFHEKFRLEKQESYRRYQEMLARSIERIKTLIVAAKFKG